MGRQLNSQFEGTIGGITFYKMMGEFFARAKSSIDGKRIKTDSAYKAFRQNSKLHGKASKLASQIYHTWPAEERVHPRFGLLTANVKQLLQSGLPPARIIQLWQQWMIDNDWIADDKR
jgi:hypothetical protein